MKVFDIRVSDCHRSENLEAHLIEYMKQCGFEEDEFMVEEIEVSDV